jgi:SAM-dependent methyltransferase
MTRDAYIARILASAETPDADAAIPLMPHRDLQLNFVGLQGEAALAQGAAFYRVVVEVLAGLGQPLYSGSRVLDFGVGWGRILRFFAHDVDDGGLFGFDVYPEVVAIAQSCNVPGNLRVIDPFPPIATIPPGSLDVVYAFSVFSHLNLSIAGDWMAEFARLLKPDGVVVVTTRARSFIELCAQLRERAGNAHESAIARAFAATSAVLAEYDGGTAVHEPMEGGQPLPSSFYGETAIPRAYVEREWARWFELIDWQADPFPGSYQSLAVLRSIPRSLG